MFKVKKQIYYLLTVSALSSFQIAGASWVALLAARDFSLVEIGIAESVFHTASLIFEIPSGVISDVFGRKRSIVLSRCMSIASAICMILSQSMWGICAGMVLSAWGYNFASGAREALSYDSLKKVGQEEKYMEFSSLELSIYRIGNASAILCAGLALLIGYKAAYAIDILLGIICLFFTLQLKEVETDELQFEGTLAFRIRKCFRESFRFLTHNFGTIRLMLWNSLLGAVAILTVFFLQAELPAAGVDCAMLGPALFVISLGGAIGARAVVLFKKWRYYSVSVICLLGITAGFVFGISSVPMLMCLGGFLANLCTDLHEVRTDAVLNERFPSSQRATLISVASLCFSVVMIILSPIAGWVFGLN